MRETAVWEGPGPISIAPFEERGMGQEPRNAGGFKTLGMAFSLHPVEKWGSLAHHLKKLNSANTLNEPWKGSSSGASIEEHSVS